MASCDTPVEYTYEGDETPTEAVVAAITAASCRDPTEMTPLHEFVDPEALNAIFRSRSNERANPSDTRIEFGIEAEHVTVTADHVSVHSSDEA